MNDEETHDRSSLIMSVAVRIRPLTRWSLARRFISAVNVSD